MEIRVSEATLEDLRSLIDQVMDGLVEQAKKDLRTEDYPEITLEKLVEILTAYAREDPRDFLDCIKDILE